jgi:nicotinamidase-related amidase
MGVLAQLREDVARLGGKNSLITENKEQAAMLYRGDIIKQGARLFDESYSRYTGLGDLLEHQDPREQFKAALTLNMLAKTEAHIERMKELYGEAVVQTSLGALAPRVLDVVRIFYPNQILTMLADIQPLDGVVGSIFVLKPRFTNSLPAGSIGAVTAGDEIFKNPTYYYASEIVGQTLGTGTGAVVTWSGVLGHQPIRPNSVTITTVVGGVTKTAVDNGSGLLTGTGFSGTNTVNYTSGAITVTAAVAADNGAPIVATYSWNSETNDTSINQIEFDMSVVPIQAKIHPLMFKYSVAAGLAASAHLAVDVQDTLAELAGQFMKQERDNLGIKLIANSATAVSTLNFTATPSIYYNRESLYADIELKLNEAETQIQIANGRGGVSWILCGTNAANIFRNSKGFMPVPTAAPIGAHLIGYLRDGTVPVIKTLTVLPADQYIVGYKGYMAGDAALVLAEWVPIYFTPVFQSPTLNNQQGLMSMYDLFVNNAKYFVSGTVSGYAA